MLHQSIFVSPSVASQRLESLGVRPTTELHLKSVTLPIIPLPSPNMCSVWLEAVDADTDDNYNNYMSTKHMFPVKALRIIVEHKSVISSVTVCVGLYVCLCVYLHMRKSANVCDCICIAARGLKGGLFLFFGVFIHCEALQCINYE